MFSRAEKQILALMSAVQFCLIVDFMMVMPLGPQLMRLFEISAKQFGALVSAYTFGAGLMGVVASFFLDRYDRKRALLVFFSGFSIVSDSIDIGRRASALGVVMSSFALASILGVPLCLVLSNKMGWHAPFIALSIFSWIVVVSLSSWLPPIAQHLLDAERGSIAVFQRLATSRSIRFCSHPSFQMREFTRPACPSSIWWVAWVQSSRRFSSENFLTASERKRSSPYRRSYLSARFMA